MLPMTETYSEPIDSHRAVEVHVSEVGEHWVGITHIRNPKDWEFHPRFQCGTGEAGRLLAESEAKRLAAGIRFDLRWMAR